MGFRKFLGPKHFGFNKFGAKKCRSKRVWVQSNFWPKRFWVQKIWVKQNVGPKKFKVPKKLGQESLIKMGSVIAEIFLPWTNVARTNVAWTYIPLQLASVKYVPRNLNLKFGQNRVSKN